MGQVLHGSARTTEAVRRAIQRSEESVRALARRHGISPTTVQKWRIVDVHTLAIRKLCLRPIPFTRSSILDTGQERRRAALLG